MNALTMAWRQLSREWRAGEMRVLALGLLIAVASLTTVAFFAERVRLALSQEAAQLLGADLLVVSDRPLDPLFAAQARALDLRVMQVVRFPSMARAHQQTLLSDIKAIDEHYPLKGKFTVATQAQGLPQRTQGAPARGTLWADARTLARLQVALGDNIGLGDKQFRVQGILVDDPDTAIGFLNLGPRIIINGQDLADTGLIQTGSRVSYRLGVAGAASAEFRSFAKTKIGPGQRVEDVREARPEIRSALERAEKFLGLAALMSALLAAVAIALAARQYLKRHLDSCAMMRCLGAESGYILRVHMLQFLLLALVASLLGCAVAYLAQQALVAMMQPAVGVALPAPNWMPVWHGLATGVVLLAGFALPPIVALRKLPTLRVLRRDMGLPDGFAVGTYGVALTALAALIVWQAQDLKLATYVLLGVTGVVLLSAGVTWLAMTVLTRHGQGLRFAARFGLANLRRRPLGSITQVVALGVGLMALLLLSFTRADLLDSWKRSLPPEAPNRFLVNVQPEQVEEVAEFMEASNLGATKLYPMVRGRLQSINGRAVASKDFAEDRAKRLIDREFNLSWSADLPVDNQILAGAWFASAQPGRAELSVESGIAQTLGLALHDKLTFDVAGERFDADITSLRKVQWDSFRVNFFVLAPPGVLENYPASYIGAFYLPAAQSQVMDQLVKRFPNLLVIDVEVILAQVQRIMDQVVKAVEFVFGFALLAGIIVLFAAIQSTQDDRLYDAAVLRTVGATGAQLRAAQAAEFALIGALAGLLAALGASAVGYVVAERVLNIPFQHSPWVWAAGLVVGSLSVLIIGMIGTRHVARTPPMELFRAS